MRPTFRLASGVLLLSLPSCVQQLPSSSQISVVHQSPTVGSRSTSPATTGVAPATVTTTGTGGGAAATTPVVTAASPTSAAGGAPVPAPGQRSTVDRPDDVNDFSVHVLYVLSADAPDEQLDTNGTLATSLAAVTNWLDGQADGHHFRIDMAGGQPDITFYRSPHTDAQLGADLESKEKALNAELLALGFADARKVYSYYYGGGHSTTAAGSDATIGLGGSGYAAVFIKALPIALAHDPATPAAYEYAFVHETLHALGYVPSTAPHATADAHTNDDPQDIMAPVQADGTLLLDPGHDDYYMANIPGSLDLSKSPFLDPRPATIQVLPDRPIALDPGSNPLPLVPSLLPASAPGQTDLETQLLAAFNAARVAAGHPALVNDPALAVAARKALSSSDGDGSTFSGQAGFGGSFAGTTGGVGRQDDATLLHDQLQVPAVQALINDASATAVGIGVIDSQGFIEANLAFGRSKLIVDSATLGLGPVNTYTVTLTLHTGPGTGSTNGRLFLDNTSQTAFTATPGVPLTLYFTVPRDGTHQVGVGLDNGDTEHFSFDQTYTVDGTAPQASALSAQ